tara:strand:+ start:655 stop:1101 length:447 start_codon:yes stop_codon:yes gene_type:complete
MTKKLTGKQDAFVKEFIINGGNATQAAITAGYSKKTANEQGAQNLAKLSIKKAIEKHREKLEKEHIWNKEKKLELLQKIALCGIRDVVDQYGNNKMENPSASVAAIKEHNIMQGDNAPVAEDIKGQPLNISFEVRTPAGDVKVTNAKS